MAVYESPVKGPDMRPSRAACRSYRAFTLTDVCVLLAAIVLLLAVVPAVRHLSFERENRVQCYKNLGQLMLAMIMYSNEEKNQAYPRTYFSDATATTPTEYTGV